MRRHDRRPVVVGKTDERGKCLKSDGGADAVVRGIAGQHWSTARLDSFSAQTNQRFDALKRRAGSQVRHE